MSESTDAKRYTADKLRQFFDSRLSEISPRSQANYRKAIRAYMAAASPEAVVAPDERHIAGWIVGMLADGISPSTAAHYLDIIAGLYAAADQAGTASADAAGFAAVKARLRDFRAKNTGFLPNAKNLDRLIALTRRARALRGTASLAADLLLYSLAAGALALRDVAMLRQPLDDARVGDVCREVAARNASPRRSYIFPLDQSAYTPRRLAVRVDLLVEHLLRLHDIPMAPTVAATVAGWWAFAAIRCGVAPADVAAHLGPGAADALPWLGICPPPAENTPLSPDVTQTIAETFAENPPRWFAMRLRARVGYADLTRALADLPAGIARPELFYPCDEVKQRIGRRLHTEQRPVIPEIVFFRTHITDITPLFRHIGHLAWCYTVSGRAGSPYAPIHRSDMERFQQTIGQFTPDYEVGPRDSITPRPGDTVVVLGGIFAGRTGRMLESVDTAAGTIYRILLPGDNNAIEWRLTDPRLIGLKH